MGVEEGGKSWIILVCMTEWIVVLFTTVRKTGCVSGWGWRWVLGRSGLKMKINTNFLAQVLQLY